MNELCEGINEYLDEKKTTSKVENVFLKSPQVKEVNTEF